MKYEDCKNALFEKIQMSIKWNQSNVKTIIRLEKNPLSCFDDKRNILNDTLEL